MPPVCFHGLGNYSETPFSHYAAHLFNIVREKTRVLHKFFEDAWDHGLINILSGKKTRFLSAKFPKNALSKIFHINNSETIGKIV